MDATDKAERRRREPWREYPRLDRRLKDWSDWLQAGTPEHIGWSVYTGDADKGLRVQLRNDCYADPVAREVETLSEDERRNWRMNAAVARLPQVWRSIVWLLYVPRRRPTNSDIAEAVGVRRRAMPDHILHALAELDREIFGQRLTRAANGDSVGYGEQN